MSTNISYSCDFCQHVIAKGWTSDPSLSLTPPAWTRALEFGSIHICDDCTRELAAKHKEVSHGHG